MPTLATIRSKVRQRADIESDTVRFPNSELNQYINDSLKKLQATLLKHSLLRDEAMHEFTGDGSSNYALPDDYLATIAVYQEESGQIRRLRMHRASDQPFAQLLDEGYGYPNSYRIGRFNGIKSIELMPRATSGTFKHAYVPVITLDADTDEFDDLLAWDEYVVLDAAIKCRMKDDIEVRDFLQAREFEWQRIVNDAETMALNDGYFLQSFGSPWMAPTDCPEAPNEPDYRLFDWNY